MGKKVTRVAAQRTATERKSEIERKCRVRKVTPTFRITLTPEQKFAKALALDNDVIVLTGKPGTSKSLLSSNIALDLLLSGRVKKIIVSRPMVDVGKSMGFLPGEAFDFKEGKSAPYLAPVLQAMYKLRDKTEIDKMIETGKIEVVPIQFIRGLNFEDCCVLIDESQNCTLEELKAISTRLCTDAKLIFTSDVNQIDLINKHSSAGFFFKKIENLKGVVLIELLQNFRSPLALEIMDAIDDYDNEKREYKSTTDFSGGRNKALSIDTQGRISEPGVGETEESESVL